LESPECDETLSDLIQWELQDGPCGDGYGSFRIFAERAGGHLITRYLLFGRKYCVL
jgi:hypothetical protein